MREFMPKNSSLYLELTYIFNSVWGHKIYHFYGVLFLAFFLSLIVVGWKKKLHDKIKILKGCVAVVFCYFTLSNQDYKWWWKSFFFGGYLYRKVLLNIFWKISCDFYVNIFNLFLLFPIKYVWCYSGMNFVSY